MANTVCDNNYTHCEQQHDGFLRYFKLDIVVSIFCIVVAVCLIVLMLMISCHRFHEEIVYVSLIDKLNQRITDYLNYINSRPHAILEWKTSDHLYWIEITAN